MLKRTATASGAAAAAAAAVCAAVALTLSACAVGPSFRTPAVPAGAEFAARTLVDAKADAVNEAWWQLFNEPLLDELVSAALKANQDIQQAQARVREARASLIAQRFDYLPTLGASASGGAQRQSNNGALGGPPAQRDFELYDAGFDARYELDLFGRVRRANQAASAQSQSAQAALAGARLGVVAEVARNYFELRGAQSRLAVARRNADYQQQALVVVQARQDAGRGTLLDTARATAQVQQTLATVAPLEAQVDRSVRRIAVLTGQVPGSLSARLQPVKAMPALPTGIALGYPAGLLRRRPDVRIAESELAASVARVGVAMGDLFPRVSLTGNVGVRALSFGALSDAGNDRYAFGPSITWGLFDYGHLRQQIAAADARSAAQLANYQQTVLLALEDTDNALSDYGRERQRLVHLQAAVTAGDQAAELAMKRFTGGVADFLTVLDAYRSALEVEDHLALGQIRTATALIAVYKALGGGWDNGAP